MHVEVEWLIHRPSTGSCPAAAADRRGNGALRAVAAGFGTDEVAELAEIERVTVHDVKAVEYYLKERLTAIAPAAADAGLAEIMHFGCTSEDINNLSYALMVRGAAYEVWLPAGARALVDGSRDGARAPGRADARAHPRPAGHADDDGQGARGPGAPPRPAAAPHRGRRSTSASSTVPPAPTPRSARPPDATGRPCPAASSRASGSTWNPLTTQIECHDWQAELYADVARFNRMLHNLCTDVWTYISLGYFAQVRGQGTVGSSTMPHKVNPIRFENAEANLEVSNALLDVLGGTLVPCRMQRDLTDCSMQRNIGRAFGHGLVAIDNVRRGLGRTGRRARADGR